MKPTPPKSSTSVRFTPEVKALLGKLAAALRSNRTYALEIAVREAGEKRGIQE